MKSLTKKILIYSMVGIMQVGLGTTVLEASPRQDNWNQGQRHETDRQQWGKQQQEQHRYERRQEENDRHEREMRRRDHESEREWRERQRIEEARHDQTLRDIEAVAVIYLLTR